MRQNNIVARRNGFSLVELLVVVGIIAILISMLLPSLTAAQRQSKSLNCQANLRQNHQFMIMYSNNNKGWMFPDGLGSGSPREQRWPVHVFTPAVWNPKTMLCPADELPNEEHSYVVNDHLPRRQIRFGATKGVSSSDVIVMGEKKSSEHDYYMDSDENDFPRLVELFRHGLKVGSNYLFLDGHVESQLPVQVKKGLDPWEPQGAGPVPPSTEPKG